MQLWNFLLLFVLQTVPSAVNAWVASTTTTTRTTAGAWQHGKQRHVLHRRVVSPSSLDASKGDVVTIECKLIPEGDFVPEPLIDGVVMHETDSPVTLSFALGWGNYLPGLHDMIAEMQEGESQSCSMDAGWGSRNPDLIASITFADSGLDKEQIKPGVQLMLANGLKCVVTETTDESFTIDANPPLAGASYTANVKLLKVEQGPEISGYLEEKADSSRFEVATFGLGCFWGGELAYMREPGVVGTAVGFTQGKVDDPSYKQVCTGSTGHTEAILVIYDPEQVSYDHLVHVAMDRLGESKYLLNQVGNDMGTQYRHGVYYHSPEQEVVARKIIESFGDDCKTECLPATTFWMAEDYHQQYLLKGGQSARKEDDSVIRCYG